MTTFSPFAAETRRASLAVERAYREAIDPKRLVVEMEHVPSKVSGFADEHDYVVSELFGEASTNVKLALSDELNSMYRTIGLSLAPALQNGLFKDGRPVNLCPFLSAGCHAICLFGAGHARVSADVKRARIAKSRLWIRDPETFKTLMVAELIMHRRRAHAAGQTLVVRLNVFSDVVWEDVFPELFTMFPDVRFYDYTKDPNRIGNTPSNYYLTFSRSEKNHAIALDMLAKGVNVAVVFENHDFPTTWNGYDVIDGTVSDLRILDPRGERGVVVALAEKDTELHGPKYAGKRNERINTAGFVLPTSTSNVWSQPVTLN